MAKDAVEIMDWVFKSAEWQKKFCDELDDMVTTFLDFPDYIPQALRDEQFARHLLWHIEDEHKEFKLLYLRGAEPSDFSTLWLHLMPFIDGRFPDQIELDDKKLARFSEKMYEIVHDLVVFHISSFKELLEQVVSLTNEIRNNS